MNIRVEHAPGEVQVILRGPEDSDELLRILALLEQDATRLWAWDECRRHGRPAHPGHHLGRGGG